MCGKILSAGSMVDRCWTVRLGDGSVMDWFAKNYSVSMSFFDHRIGSKAEAATVSVPKEAVVVAQPARSAPIRSPTEATLLRWIKAGADARPSLVVLAQLKAD